MLLIGKIIGTRGLKGEVKIYPYTNAIDDFDRIDRVFLDADVNRPLSIKKHRIQKNLLLAFFEEIDNIDDAEEIKNTEIYLSEEESNKFLSNDSYFYKDVIGFDVKDENGNPLGKIKAINTNSKQDVFIIDKDGKEWFLPNVKRFVKEVNLEKEEFIVDIIEGLIDED